MRAPRLRFTVRWLMLAVGLAVVAVGGGVWGYRMWRLSNAYEGKAQFYKTVEENLRMVGAIHRRGAIAPEELMAEYAAQGMPTSNPNAARHSEEAAHNATKAAYFADLVRKYERAARYPWLGVEPDPPVP